MFEEINTNTFATVPATVVIFGASGDLTLRKLIPALYSLFCKERLPKKFAVLGVARSEFSDETFREKLLAGIKKFSKQEIDAKMWKRFSKLLHYHQGNYDDPQTYQHLDKRLQAISKAHDTQGNHLFYLSTPPGLYSTIVKQLGEADLARSTEAGWRRIIIEKPFGRDLPSARALNEQIHQVFMEDQIYRIDHYLGKETVQNLLVFRFANAIFEPLWNRNYIDHVQIMMTESVGLEGRAGYYDNTGVMRDMIQNHLLQLLSLTAMEPPVAFEATPLRDEKVKVLRAVRPTTVDEIDRYTVRAQYRTYRDEPGVAKGSKTPTYAALKLWIDNWRWRGVPFYLRSGKNLAAKVSEITIQFKRIPHLMFPLAPGEVVPPNRLSLCLQPDEGMHLKFQTKIPGAGMSTHSVDMDFHYAEGFNDYALPDAYERLLLDAIQGDASLFTRSDEIETAWSIVDPIIKNWEETNSPPLVFYEANTWGPSAADRMLKRNDRKWQQGCGGHS